MSHVSVTRHATRRTVQELVQLHLAPALLVGAHHEKVDFFAGKIYGNLGLRLLVQLLEFAVAALDLPLNVCST